jgi:hypothetical protein
VGIDAGRPDDPSAVGAEGPLVDVLDHVLVMGEPRPGAADVAAKGRSTLPASPPERD